MWNRFNLVVHLMSLILFPSPDLITTFRRLFSVELYTRSINSLTLLVCRQIYLVSTTGVENWSSNHKSLLRPPNVCLI